MAPLSCSVLYLALSIIVLLFVDILLINTRMDGWMELSITNLAARPNAGSATCDFNGIISEQFPGLLCMFHDNNYTTVFL